MSKTVLNTATIGKTSGAPGPDKTTIGRCWAVMALCLIAPAPTIGVLVGLTFEPGAVGTILWMACKVWLFGLPVTWRVFVDKQPLSCSPARQGGFLVATAAGVAMSLAIIVAYTAFARDAIDPGSMHKKLHPLGLTDPTTYLGMAAFIVFVNSALEEYVYRWFVFRKWELLVGGRLAVFGSASVFVVHHSLILAAYFPTWIVALGSAGVFLGGVVWSWLYLRYRSIWPPFVSHAMVDVAILGIGYWIVFQPGGMQ
jgi:membrane protease YdiL (CAAX protease family)